MSPTNATAPGPLPRNQVRGILLKLAAVAIFSVMAACIKAARVEAPAGETVFFRAAIAMVPVLAYAAWTGQLRAAVTTHRIRGHFWRGFIGCTAMGLSFAALGLLPLPEVIAIGFATPLIATVLAVLLLGEVVRLYRWSAVVVGLLGVLVMVWPRLTVVGEAGIAGLSDGAALGAACMLVAAGLMALSQIHVRWLARTEPTLAIVFFFHVSCTLASLLTLPFGWVWPSAEVWAYLIGAGVAGGIAQILVTESYRHADASTIAPFDYSSMLYGLLIGWLIFGEVPDRMVWIGGALVVGAGLVILYRERRLGLLAAKSKARPGLTPQG